MSIKGAGYPVHAAIHSRPQQLQLLGDIFPLLDGAAVKEDEGKGHALNGNGERAVGARIDRFILPILPQSKAIADGEPAKVQGRGVADRDRKSVVMAIAGRTTAVGRVEIIRVSMVKSGKLSIVHLRETRKTTR